MRLLVCRFLTENLDSLFDLFFDQGKALFPGFPGEQKLRRGIDYCLFYLI